jgi:hypothetical protein
VPTFYIKWDTPDGEKSDWIWAESLRDAELEAIGREAPIVLEREAISQTNWPAPYRRCPCCLRSWGS